MDFQSEGYSTAGARIMQCRVDENTGLTRRTLLAMAAIVPTLATAGLASAVESAPTGPTALPPDLAKAVDDYNQATIHNDVETLGRLITEDYTLVNSDATLQNKQSYLTDFKVPGFRLDPYVMEQPVLKVWDNTALTGGLLHLNWTQDGRHQGRVLRIVHVWAKRDGHWRLTYTQLTRVPQ
jgi:ketosteroid isomerase-like protein